MAKTTQRPETTEDEVTTLLDRTFKMGVKNHILLIDCDDYRSMLDDVVPVSTIVARQEGSYAEFRTDHRPAAAAVRYSR